LYTAPQDNINIISPADHKPDVLNFWKMTKDTAPEKPIPAINDTLWIPMEKFYGIENNKTGNWLIKTEIMVIDPITTDLPYGLFPQNYFSAYEIYWDGNKIGENGKIGQDIRSEKPGYYIYDLMLKPDFLLPGKHTLILRLSNFSDKSAFKWYYGAVVVGSVHIVLNNSFKKRYNSFLLAGLLFIPFLFNLFLYFGRKYKTEHLLFSLICLDVIFDFFISQLPVFINVPTTFIHFLYNSYSVLVILNCILFPAFLVFAFSANKKLVLPLIFICNLIIFFFFTDLWNMFNIMPLLILIQGSLITIYAAYKKKDGSIIILTGFIIAWIGYFLNYQYIQLITVMVICTSLSIARQFARTEKDERLARLRTTRLENELLKKNINPHFLMNTLTSIIAWLRKEPESAVKLIEALADEFRMITQISSLQLIPICREIELCNAHLKIMSYRKGADFKLITNGIKEEENIPPMIFHTLIENGLTHGYGNKDKGTFTLTRNDYADLTEYIVTNDGEFNNSGKNNSGGMGLQYVEARLEESFPGKWELHSHENSKSWEVIIRIKKD
jgi:hypothetical protein